MMINIEEKELDKALIKYLISPFHSDSVEGMDLSINKPYLITCSKDKSVRVLDYQNKIHVISKIFEEELYQIEDSKALDWLNGQVITEIKDYIDKLRHKIDELKVHYTLHIKKQKEEKEKLQYKR